MEQGPQVGDRIRLTGSGWRDIYPEIVSIASICSPGSRACFDQEDIQGGVYAGVSWSLELPEHERWGWEFDGDLNVSSPAPPPSKAVGIDQALKWVSDDPVNTPSHYQHPSGIEVIEITRHESFLRGNVLKYVLRAPYKGNELEDLKKAAKYLAWEIERVENAVSDA